MSGVAHYRKKPVVIEAVRVDTLDYDGMCEIVTWCGGTAVGEDEDNGRHVIAIDTLEGRMYADGGDWIIRGIKGEFYPCKPDIFAGSYDADEEPGPVESAGKVVVWHPVDSSRELALSMAIGAAANRGGVCASTIVEDATVFEAFLTNGPRETTP